jgi:hypothetical protein
MTFAETVEHLAGWERRRVTVRAYTQTWREMVPHAHMHMHGRLGTPELGGTSGATRLNVAWFALGPAQHGDSPRNGFVLRSDDFVQATALNRTQLKIECGRGLRIEVHLE